jgi:adenylate cyclase
MPIEIERKFLVANDSWRQEAIPLMTIVQGYLAKTDDVEIRVRIKHSTLAELTIKGKLSGASRPELEIDIPIEQARQILSTFNCPTIEKTRYTIDDWWEIDVFEGNNAGLVLVEVELDSEDEHIDLPSWVGEEVTHLPQYYNAQLAMNGKPNED